MPFIFCRVVLWAVLQKNLDFLYTYRYIYCMDKKEEILKNALTLFSKEGYDNVGIQRIVAAAEVTKPTLYYYFGSKNGLLQTLLDTYFGPFLKALETSAHYQGDLPLTLEKIAVTFFGFAGEHKEFYRIVLALMFAPEKSEGFLTAFKIVQEEYRILESVFKQAEADHGNMKGRSKNYAVTFLGMLNSYISLYLTTGEKPTKPGIYEICRQYMYGIFS